MKDMTNESKQLHQLKGELHNVLFKPLEYNYRDMHSDNIRIFTKADSSVFRPLLTGEVGVEKFEDLFDELFDQYYKHVVDICLNNLEKMQHKSNSLTILVRSKGADVLFIVFDDRDRDGYFSLIPVTIMKKCKYMKADYTVDIPNKEVRERGVCADEISVA